jgi:hypothetical protein
LIRFLRVTQTITVHHGGPVDVEQAKWVHTDLAALEPTEARGWSSMELT